MDKAAELALFESLARGPVFRAWVQARLTKEFSVLVQMVDIEQLRKAQGRAGLLQDMLTLLDKAPTATGR
jgi:hypothetical protein